MVHERRDAAGETHVPTAFFMGDFNVGKSTLINALLRREVLVTGREESHTLPVFVTRSTDGQAQFAALPPEGSIDSRSHEEFLSIRRAEHNERGYTALGVRLPASPFSRMVLVDTAGMSSDDFESVEVADLADQGAALFVVVTDIEYWSAKHTMDFIAFHHEIFGGALLIVANKADHLNVNEIRRIVAKAPTRLENYGVKPAPPFFALSARLEGARQNPQNEYRNRVRPAVREQCDGGFDAFRVALYEFEAAHTKQTPGPGFEQLLTAPLAESFIRTQLGGGA